MKRNLGQLLALLFVVGAVIAYWWVIALILGVVVAVFVGRWVWDDHKTAAAARARELAGIRARADEQHNQVMSGDDRGVFGEYPAAPI
jgi:hypothetical protein